MKRLILAASVIALGASPAFAAGASRADSMNQAHHERAATADSSNQVAAAGNPAGVNAGTTVTGEAATPSATTPSVSADGNATVTTPDATARANTGTTAELSAAPDNTPAADSSGNQTQRRLESGRTADPNQVPAQ